MGGTGRTGGGGGGRGREGRTDTSNAKTCSFVQNLFVHLNVKSFICSFECHNVECQNLLVAQIRQMSKYL